MVVTFPFSVKYMMVSLNQKVEEMVLKEKTCENGIKNSNNQTVDNYFCMFKLLSLDEICKTIIDEYIRPLYPDYGSGKPILGGGLYCAGNIIKGSIGFGNNCKELHN